MLLYDSYTIYDTPDYTYDGNRLYVVEEDDTVDTDDYIYPINIGMAEMTDTITGTDSYTISLDMGLMFDNGTNITDDIDLDLSYNPEFEDIVNFEEDYQIKLYKNGVETLFDDRIKKDSTWINREKTLDSWTQRNKVDTTYKTRNKPWLP